MPELSMDRPAVIEGVDPEEIAEQFRGWRIELIHLGHGPIHRSGVVVALEGVQVTGINFGRAAVLRGSSPRGLASMLFSDPASPSLRVASRSVDDDTCLMLGSLAPLDAYLPAGCRACIVSIASCGPSRVAGPLDNLPARNVSELRSLPPEHRFLLDHVIDLLEQLRRSEAPDIIGAHMQNGLRELLLPSVAQLFSRSLTLPHASDERTIRRLAVSRACAYIDASLAKPITLSDLCKIAGARARTLEYGFREFYEVGPMTYLRSVRLCRARRDLSNPKLVDGSVATAAHRWCFTHMGQFSRDYRVLFGESPSQTLARSRMTVPPPREISANPG